VRVTPRASKNEISEILDDGTLKVRLTTGASEAKTNQALIDLLVEILFVQAGNLEIVAGVEGNDKLVTIRDLDAATVQQRLLKALSKS
jgi:uncharacterized protein YggU (UPF0235/DUF167 family)